MNLLKQRPKKLLIISLIPCFILQTNVNQEMVINFMNILYQRLDADSTTISAGRTSDSLAYTFSATNGGREGTVIHFYGPNIAQPTAARSLHVNSYANAWLVDYAWTHNQSVAYDGFSFIAYSGSITGLVCVYGMRK